MTNSAGFRVPPASLTPVDAIALVDSYYAANALIDHWYLDKTAGNDANSGTDAAHPLKTGAELSRRLGPLARWSHSVTVEVLENGLDDALIVQGALLSRPLHVDIIGKPTQLATGTVGAYVKRSHVTREGNILTATGIADLTPYLWKRVRMTTGIRAGGVFWITKINPAGGGLNTARVSQMAIVSTSDNFQMLDNFRDPPVGDSFVIESIPFVPSITTKIDGPAEHNAGANAFGRRKLFFGGVDTEDLSDLSSADSALNTVVYFGGRISNWYPRSQLNYAGRAVIFGCTIYQRTATYYQYFDFCGNVSACAIGDGVNFSSLTSNSAVLACTWQGCGVIISADVYASDCQIFDWYPISALSSAVSLNNGTLYVGVGLSGYTAGIGRGLTVNNSARVRGIELINLIGSSGAVYLAAAPAVDLTFAQVTPCSDFAQKGIATLVAGTVTLTVPWYDSAVQRVQATHAAFAGTPGILSVQQISNTQFTIASSNAADTSTVNWSISPLGRNIHFA